LTVDLSDVTLNDLCENIKKSTGVRLQAASRLGNFRISVVAKGWTVSALMGRIQDLLHHGGDLSAHSCYWLRIDEKPEPLYYYLTQSHEDLDAEAENAGVPSKILAHWLRDIRAYTVLPSDKRHKFKTDFPRLRYYAERGESPDTEFTGPFSEAVATLSDSEIETLASTGRVDAPGFTLAPDVLPKLTETAKATGAYDARFTSALGHAFLKFEPDDYPGHYALFLHFGSGPITQCSGGCSFDTLGNVGAPIWIQREIEQIEKTETAKPVDLFVASERVEGKTPYWSLHTALDRWRKATGKTAFGELFLKEKRGVPITAGKPETLLTRICVDFGYGWRKVGSDYLVYSRSWGADRAADIPEALAAQWQQAIKKTNSVPIDMLLEMSRLKDAQIPTLHSVLYIPAFARKLNVWTLRLLDSLSKPEREVAMNRKGHCSMNTNDPRVLSALSVLFPRARDVRGAELSVGTNTVQGHPAYTITITLPTGESQYGYMTTVPGQPPMHSD